MDAQLLLHVTSSTLSLLRSVYNEVSESHLMEHHVSLTAANTISLLPHVTSWVTGVFNFSAGPIVVEEVRICVCVLLCDQEMPHTRFQVSHLVSADSSFPALPLPCLTRFSLGLTSLW